MAGRYKLISENSIGNGSKVIDTETGQEIQGVRSAVARVEVDKANLLELEIVCVAAEVASDEVQLRVMHPISGEWKQVREIVFEDGTAVLMVQGRMLVSDGE